MVDILIKNFRGVARAAFSLDGGIALIAGRNRMGKTSTLHPISLALSRQPSAVTGVKGPNAFSHAFLKRDLGQYVKDGEAVASATLAEGEETVTLSWPDGEITATGGAPQADIISSGLVRFGALDAGARKALLIHFLKADPTAAEVEAELKDERWSKAEVDALWESVQKNGWDGSLTAEKTRASEARGAWQAITGELRYGSKKAVTWRPEGWDDSLRTMDQRQLKDDAASAVQDRDSLQREQGALEREIAKDEEGIGKLEEWRVSLTKWQTAKLDIGAEIEKGEKDLARLPTGDGDSGAKCPKCGAQLSPKYEGGLLSLVEFKAPANQEGFDKLVKERNAVKKALAENRGKFAKAVDTIKSLEIMIKAAEEAKTTRGKKGERLAVVKEKAAALLEKSIILTQRARAVDQIQRCADQHRIVLDAEKRIAVLEPDGLRRRVLMGRMTDFNARLAKICAAAKWGTVKVDGHFCLRLEDRHYVILSGAEKKIADTAAQLAIAAVTRASMVVIDEADKFDQTGRNQLFLALAKAKVPAVVGMTMNKPDQVPDLSKANMGDSYWIEDGNLVSVLQAAEK